MPLTRPQAQTSYVTSRSKCALIYIAEELLKKLGTNRKQKTKTCTCHKHFLWRARAPGTARASVGLPQNYFLLLFFLVLLRALLGLSQASMSSIPLLSGDGIGVDHAAFQPGSIKRIELTNFMTHAQVVLQPSSAVNFVLGANGSGKSSLVCAMCLGLGGDVRDMERGSKLEDYIMKGKTFAIIKVSFYTCA